MRQPRSRLKWSGPDLAMQPNDSLDPDAASGISPGTPPGAMTPPCLEGRYLC